MTTIIPNQSRGAYSPAAYESDAEQLTGADRARLSYSERTRIDGAPVDRLAFSIAARVARDYFARLTGWGKKEGEAIALVMHARATLRAGGKRKLPHAHVESASGFSRACVEPSTLEEMALASRAVLVAARDEVARGEGARYEDETMTLAFRMARRALNREREQSLDALGLEKIPDASTDDELRDIDARRRFLALARIYCAKRRALRSYWEQTKSRKWRAGFAGDCAILRNAFDVAMGSGHGRDAAKGSAFRERVSALRTRLEAGELARTLANN